jgi:primase-polymerase (primpol)-like protein
MGITESADLPELRAHIRARRGALAGFMEQGAWLALEGDLLRVIPRKDIYIRYLNDNRDAIGELASEACGHKIRVEISLDRNGDNHTQRPADAKPPAAERPAASDKQADGSNPRPTPKFRPAWDNIPSELTMLSQWVLWRYEWRKDQWTKPPYQPDDTPASSTDPATWSSFDAVQAAYDAHRDRFDGVGVVLDGSGLVAWDFDHVVGAEEAISDEKVAEYIRMLDSYGEISPSGTGLRGLVFGRLPPKDRKIGNIECYETERYVTITGRHVLNTPQSINERQDAINVVHAEVFAARIAKRAATESGPRANGTAKAANLDDRALLDKARHAKNGERFCALYDRGDWKTPGFPSPSEADLSLCSMLAFWCGADKARVDQLFRASGLNRPKWEERTDYRERTLEAAIATCTESYESRNWQNNMNGVGSAKAENLSESEKRDSGNASAALGRAELKNGQAETQCDTFLDYRNVDEVRKKLTSFHGQLRADINTVYETEYTTAAAALEHFEPAEFQRLLNVLKGKGIRITRWEHTVKEYGRNERLRIAEARKTTLKQTRAAAKNRRGQGQVLEFAEPEPAAQADGIELAQDIADELKRFVIVNLHQRVAIILWVLFSYLIDVFDFAPRLAITSPEMGCGKSTLIEFLSSLAYRAITCSSISSAAIYRTIEMFKPTLLMDEQDLKKGQPDEGAEERRKVLNSGHKRSTAFVIKVVGDDLEPRRFSTFTPIAHASIGEVQPTLMDRAVPIAMQRKRPGEHIESMRSSGKDARRNAARLVEIKSRIVKWTSDHRDAIAQAEPGLPQALSSRQADNWSPLVAIADCLGNEWGAQARAAAATISGKNSNDRTIGVLLLKDLRELFQQQAKGEDLREVELSSAFIVEKLGEMEDRPWSEWGRNRKPISPRQLAVLLSPFAIVPVKLRIGESTPNGYKFKAFEDVFSRYTLTPEDSNRNTGTTAGGVGENGDFGSGTEAECSGSEKGTSAYAERECAAAPDEKPKRGVGPATNDAKASEGMEF